MLFADKLGMPKKIKDLAESLDLEVTNHHDQNSMQNFVL